jgi:hypothetical protein
MVKGRAAEYPRDVGIAGDAKVLFAEAFATKSTDGGASLDDSLGQENLCPARCRVGSFAEWPSFRWKVGHSFARLLADVSRTSGELVGERIDLLPYSKWGRMGDRKRVVHVLNRGSLLTEPPGRSRGFVNKLTERREAERRLRRRCARFAVLLRKRCSTRVESWFDQIAAATDYIGPIAQ